MVLSCDGLIKFSQIFKSRKKSSTTIPSESLSESSRLILLQSNENSGENVQMIWFNCAEKSPTFFSLLMSDVFQLCSCQFFPMKINDEIKVNERVENNFYTFKSGLFIPYNYLYFVPKK